VYFGSLLRLFDPQQATKETGSIIDGETSTIETDGIEGVLIGDVRDLDLG